MKLSSSAGLLLCSRSWVAPAAAKALVGDITSTPAEMIAMKDTTALAAMVVPSVIAVAAVDDEKLLPKLAFKIAAAKLTSLLATLESSPQNRKYRIKRLAEAGGDWHTLSCPSEYSIVGGGCDAYTHPFVYQVSAPTEDGRAWKCGGHGGGKLVFAVCVRDEDMPGLTVVKSTGDDWHEVQCPSAAPKILSGGCNAYENPWRYEDSTPGGTNGAGWVCGGHGGDKEVFAICSPDLPTATAPGSGGDWTEAHCPDTYALIGGGCDVDGAPHKIRRHSPHSSEPNTYICGGHGPSKKVYAICLQNVVEEGSSYAMLDSEYRIKRVAEQGGDWHTLSCPSEYSIVGGGCDAYTHPFVYQVSAPTEDGRAWQCGGHGGNKQVFAVCVHDEDMPGLTVVKSTGDDWHEVQCPNEAPKILSGGCNAYENPWRYEDSTVGGTNGAGWVCGGHGGDKEVFAICSSEPDLPTATAPGSGGDWTEAYCPDTYALIGGGCDVDGAPHKIRRHSPQTSSVNTYICGGWGPSKKVSAICLQNVVEEGSG